MAPDTPEHDREPTDDVMRRRLSALRGRAVPLDGLEARLALQIPRDGAEIPPTYVMRRPAAWRRHVVALAASVAVLAGAAIFTASVLQPRPVLAAPHAMAVLHDEALAMPMSMTPVSDFGQARAALAREWKSGPVVPGVAQAVPRCCCMRTLGSKPLKCVALDVGGQQVVMTVAHERDIRLPTGRTVTVGGRPFIVTAHGGVNMVMGERDGRWVCLMGKLDETRLIELASSIEW